MTSLLAAVREDEAVMATTMAREFDRWDSAIVVPNERDAYDTAFLRAAVRELARRVREKADTNPATPRGQGFQSGLMSAADFIEGSLE